MASPRALHFLGTMPQFDDATAALTWQLTELDGRLRRLTSGETGPRLLWFVPFVKELKAAPNIRALRDGDWTDYDDVDRLAVRRGARLTPADLPLRIAEYARKDLAALTDLDPGAGLPLQIGVPGYLDMALFIFGPLGVPRYARTFLTAIADQITEIQREAGERVVFQLEVPAALIAVLSAPRPLRPLLAEFMAHLVTRPVARAPQGTRFGVHLCLGDLGHHALKQLKDASSLVILANAIARRWPAGRSLDYLHLPMSGGDVPPPTEAGFYAPLRRLRMPEGVEVIAGIAHEDQDTRTQLAVRGLVEDALGHPVDIATSCGLGRRTPDAAAAAVTSMRTLLD
jgi:hypothetical protein